MGGIRAARPRTGPARRARRCSPRPTATYSTPIRSTAPGATRRTVDAQLERRFATGPLAHRLILAAEDEREAFHARDTIYGGFTDQDRTRGHQGFTAEWRGERGGWNGGLAIRRDRFNRFKDATSLRASLLADSQQRRSL